MTDHPKPSDAELDRAKIMFVSDLAMEKLLTDARKAKDVQKGCGVSPSRLYAFAVGGPEVPDADIEEVLETDPILRAVYHRMVRAAAKHAFPPVRAASSETAPVRETAGCRIEISEDDGEVFVMIRLASDAPIPTLLTVFGRDGLGRRVELPDPLRGLIHFPITQDMVLMELLRDPASEVYLS